MRGVRREGERSVRSVRREGERSVRRERKRSVRREECVEGGEHWIISIS